MYCKSKGYERFHAEENCRTKAYDLSNQRFNNANRSAPVSNIKPKVDKPSINNVELEEFFAEIQEESKHAPADRGSKLTFRPN